MANETLKCKSGNHSWVRQSARGRKPADCPEHTKQTIPSNRSQRVTQPSEPTGVDSPTPTNSQGLTAALSGKALGEHLYLVMQPLIERDRKRRKPKPKP